ncbi:hypothetical protein Tco_0530531 [Tanacetum coccineum]
MRELRSMKWLDQGTVPLTHTMNILRNSRERKDVIFDLELVPSCLINSDLELYEIINLASLLEHHCLEYDHVDMNPTELEKGNDNLRFCEDRFVIRTSQSRQHDKRSSKSPTIVLFDVDTGKISNRHCEH